jgi:hypothetical protein
MVTAWNIFLYLDEDAPTCDHPYYSESDEFWRQRHWKYILSTPNGRRLEGWFDTSYGWRNHYDSYEPEAADILGALYFDCQSASEYRTGDQYAQEYCGDEESAEYAEYVAKFKNIRQFAAKMKAFLGATRYQRFVNLDADCI